MKIFNSRSCFLNAFERSVFRDGKHLELTPKAFDVLQLLLERSGDTVTKDQMLGSVWDGDFVEEGNLPVQISKLRKLLHETGETRFIETIQGVGYRFIAPVRSVSKAEWLRATAKYQRGTSVDRRRVDSVDRRISDATTTPPLLTAGNSAEINALADQLTEINIKMSQLLGLNPTERLDLQKQKRPRKTDKDVAKCASCAPEGGRKPKTVTALSKPPGQIKSRKRTR